MAAGGYFLAHYGWSGIKGLGRDKGEREAIDAGERAVSLAEIEQARREALRARDRFESTLAAVQQRLRPGNLAERGLGRGEGKGADLADGALRR